MKYLANKILDKTLIAIGLTAIIGAPATMAEGLSPEQIADEYANMHADGSLPFIHSAVVYGDSSVSDVIWTDEYRAEFENLHADGSLPFVYSPDAMSAGVGEKDVVWTDEFTAKFRNLHSDGSLL